MTSLLKDEYIKAVREEYGLVDATVALELFINGSLSLRQFIKALRWQFEPEDYVFFDPMEVELRQKMTYLILEFLSGYMTEEELFDQLRQFT